MYKAMSEGERGEPGSLDEAGLDVPGGDLENGKDVPGLEVNGDVYPQHGDESPLDQREDQA